MTQLDTTHTHVDRPHLNPINTSKQPKAHQKVTQNKTQNTQTTTHNHRADTPTHNKIMTTKIETAPPIINNNPGRQTTITQTPTHAHTASPPNPAPCQVTKQNNQTRHEARSKITSQPDIETSNETHQAANAETTTPTDKTPNHLTGHHANPTQQQRPPRKTPAKLNTSRATQAPQRSAKKKTTMENTKETRQYLPNQHHVNPRNNPKSDKSTNQEANHPRTHPAEKRYKTAPPHANKQRDQQKYEGNKGRHDNVDPTIETTNMRATKQTNPTQHCPKTSETKTISEQAHRPKEHDKDGKTDTARRHERTTTNTPQQQPHPRQRHDVTSHNQNTTRHLTSRTQKQTTKGTPTTQNKIAHKREIQEDESLTTTHNGTPRRPRHPT